MADYTQSGYDVYFRWSWPVDPNAMSAAQYDAFLEDQSVTEAQLGDGSVTDQKIQNISAEKILAGTISVGLALGGPTVKILGDNPAGATMLFYNNGIPSILIGESDVTVDV